MTHRRTSFSTQRPALATTADRCHIGQVTIDMLPDDALLKIFDFFVDDNDSIDAWHSLVHACRKWRNIVFGSPRRMNLHLHCTAGRPVKELLDIWPDLPIVIKLYDPATWDVDDIVAAPALAHTDRVCEISLGMAATSLLEVIFAAMQVPFLAPMRLNFLPEHETVPIAPDSFLGESASHLRSLYLGRVPFPVLPKPLCSATDIVRLTLHRTPHSGYIPPEAMVTCLTTLKRLEFLGLDFESPRSYPNWEGQHLPLPTHTHSVLPALTQFEFRGISEYLEDLAARIDAPLLDELYIVFFHQLVFDTPHLAHFINRTPGLKPHNKAQVMFLDDAVQVLLGSMQKVILRTRIQPPDWQLSFVARVCNSFLPLVPAPEHLFICEGIQHSSSRSRWQDDIENSQWLELLYPFTNVKNLYLSEGVVPRIAPALQELVEGGVGVTEVLPVLESLFLEERHPSGPIDESYISTPVQEATGIGMFVAARQLSTRPTDSGCWRGRGTSVISQMFTGPFY
jgi:hypothetical protein